MPSLKDRCLAANLKWNSFRKVHLPRKYALAVLAFLALLRFLPKGGPWGQLVLQSAVGGEPAGVHALLNGGKEELKIGALIGQTGVAATPLFPSGQVEIHGRRYEARMAMGFAETGAPVVVTGRSEFSLIVEPIQS